MHSSSHAYWTEQQCIWKQCTSPAYRNVLHSALACSALRPVLRNVSHPELLSTDLTHTSGQCFEIFSDVCQFFATFCNDYQYLLCTVCWIVAICCLHCCAKRYLVCTIAPMTMYLVLNCHLQVSHLTPTGGGHSLSDNWDGEDLYLCIWVFGYLWIWVFAYLCICVYGSDSPGREKWAICGTFF